MTDHPRRILSTRSLTPALLEQAAGKGILIDTVAFIATEPVVDALLHQQIQQLSRRPIVAVFTSMNAVEAVAQQLGLPAGVALWQLYCIGYATQQLVRQYFGEDCIAGTAASASALADTMTQQHDLREVFFFCGNQRRDELPEKLQEKGIRVNEYIVYRTILTPHRVEQIYDGIIFFSPSAVHSFFPVNTLPEDTLLFAIGQTTADTIRTYTSNRTILSESPEKEALIRQMIDYYNK